MESSVPMQEDFKHPEPNEETLEALRETAEMIVSGAPGYATVEDMFRAMGIEE